MTRTPRDDWGRFRGLKARLVSVPVTALVLLAEDGLMVVAGVVAEDDALLQAGYPGPVVRWVVGQPSSVSDELVLAGAQSLSALVVLDVLVRFLGARRAEEVLTVWKDPPELPSRLRYVRTTLREHAAEQRAKYGPSIRPARYGAMEVAMVPVLTLVPLWLANSTHFAGETDNWPAAALVLGFVLAVLSFSFGAYGRAWIAMGVALLAWPSWAVLVSTDHFAAATLVSGALAIVFCVAAYRVLARLRREQAARQAAEREPEQPEGTGPGSDLARRPGSWESHARHGT